MRRALCGLGLLLWAAAASPPAGAAERRNWFDDPFLPLANALPDCPLPAGPYITEEQRRRQSHNRAERGTTCWLAGQCERPTFYDYDRDIARAIEAALRAPNPVADGTLWATVQGRIVYVEGCVRDERSAARIEAWAMALPHVQRAVAIVYVPAPGRKPPYEPRNAP